MTDTAVSLKERLAAFAEEAREEREALEARRRELAADRDADIEAIRTRHLQAAHAEMEEARRDWKARIAEVGEELQAARRIDRALNPPEPKPKKPKSYPSRSPLREGRKWRPRDETLLSALQAMRDGADTISLITAASPLSRASIDHAVATMRDDGLVRLTGERPTSPNAKTPTRTYAITPAGLDFLTSNETGGNGAHA